jgi:ferredoxin
MSDTQTAALRRIAGELLAAGKVDIVAGFTPASLPLRSRPFFIRRAEDAARLTCDPFAEMNLARYLVDLRGQRAAIVARGCEARAITVLLRERQIDRGQITILGWHCAGIVDRRRVEAEAGSDVLAAEVEGDTLLVRTRRGEMRLALREYLSRSCQVCGEREPAMWDVLLDEDAPAGGERDDATAERHAMAGDPPSPCPSPCGGGGDCLSSGSGACTPSPDKGADAALSSVYADSDHLPLCRGRDRVRVGLPPAALAAAEGTLAAEFEALPPAERWARFQRETARCIRCYACRQACPLCYCGECFVERTSPRWTEASVAPSGQQFWHIMRAYHQAGRCARCGACERACPLGIPLLHLTDKLNALVHTLYGPEADLELDAETRGAGAEDAREEIP